ncbi:hypothetical protein CBR_g48652 [Chara braunii]|uniref:Uncharacterized protein n=1 Tax=Chara braunii TaxID=69332 RepID=A0A388M3K2_CHABU|nr:hypothetical protein CBR_g48652 [Chara braunii]|eukprot:GBG89043.1 hypothetical protein CBR_g48652 [Chara braunii]
MGRDRYTKYHVTSLERRYNHRLVAELDLGIPLDLLYLALIIHHVCRRRWTPRHRADQRRHASLLVRHRGEGAAERSVDKGMNGLVKTQCILQVGPEPMRVTVTQREAEQKRMLKEGIMAYIKAHTSMEKQIRAIEESFEKVKTKLVHHTKPEMEAEEIWPLLLHKWLTRNPTYWPLNKMKVTLQTKNEKEGRTMEKEEKNEIPIPSKITVKRPRVRYEDEEQRRQLIEDSTKIAQEGPAAFASIEREEEEEEEEEEDEELLRPFARHEEEENRSGEARELEEEEQGEERRGNGEERMEAKGGPEERMREEVEEMEGYKEESRRRRREEGDGDEEEEGSVKREPPKYEEEGEPTGRERDEEHKEMAEGEEREEGEDDHEGYGEHEGDERQWGQR